MKNRRRTPWWEYLLAGSAIPVLISIGVGIGSGNLWTGLGIGLAMGLTELGVFTMAG